jgi:MFS family permease
LGVLIGAAGPALIVYVWATKDMSAAIRIVGTLVGLAIAVVGYTYPVYRYLTRALVSSTAENKTPVAPIIRRMLLAACLGGVALLGTWGSTQWGATWAGQLTQNNPNVTNPREWTQIFLAIGAIIGTILAALAGDWFGRRLAYCLLCLLSLLSAVYFFQFHSEYGPSFLVWAFISGACTASFYGWLPLYLPELFPTKVRATGQGFGFNFGRILAAIGTLQMSALLPFFKDMKTFAGLQGGYPVACSCISGIYLVGMVLIWFAPETKGKPLPE